MPVISTHFDAASIAAFIFDSPTDNDSAAAAAAGSGLRVELPLVSSRSLSRCERADRHARASCGGERRGAAGSASFGTAAADLFGSAVAGRGLLVPAEPIDP